MPAKWQLNTEALLSELKRCQRETQICAAMTEAVCPPCQSKLDALGGKHSFFCFAAGFQDVSKKENSSFKIRGELSIPRSQHDQRLLLSAVYVLHEPSRQQENKLCLLFPQVGRCGLLSACLSSKNRLQKHVCNHPACTLVPALTYQNPSDAKCATCALEIKLSGQRAILSISWTFMPRCELSRQWTGWNETLTPQLEFCWWLQWRTPQKWHLGSLTAAPSAPWPAWEKRRKPVRTWASAPNVFSTSFWCIWFILGSKTSLRLEVTSWGQGKLWEAASSTKLTVMNYDLHHAVTVFTTFLEQNVWNDRPRFKCVWCLNHADCQHN